MLFYSLTFDLGSFGAIALLWGELCRCFDPSIPGNEVREDQICPNAKYFFNYTYSLFLYFFGVILIFFNFFSCFYFNFKKIAGPKFHQISDRRKFLEELAQSQGLDPLVPASWYKIASNEEKVKVRKYVYNELISYI